MTETMLGNAVEALFEVAEVSSIGGVPLDVVVEALKLVNPDLEAEQAQMVAQQCDARGRQVLARDDFVAAVRTVLQNTEVTDAVHMLTDLVLRMRMTYRRRYLMYETPANRCAPALLQNVKAVEMYRELFDVVANGDDYISRHDLRTLANEVLPEYPTDAANIVKAALGEGERDLIGFQEFIMVLQPATSRRQLSEMLKIAKHRVGVVERSFDDWGGRQWQGQAATGTPSTDEHRAGGVQRIDNAPLTSSIRPMYHADEVVTGGMTSPPPSHHGTPTPQRGSPAPASNFIGARPKAMHAPSSGGGTPTKAANLSLHHELQQAKQHHEAAEARFRSVLSGPQHINLSTIAKLTDVGAAMKMPSLQERDLAELRLENEALKHKVSLLESNQYPRQQTPIRASRTVIAGDSGASLKMHAYTAELEAELRNARAQLAVRTEAAQLIALLNKSNTTHEGLRQYYHDERTLISKQEYLRSVSSTLHDDDGTSPVSLVLSQYDLIVCGYQALYRELLQRSEKERSVKRRGFDAAAAASSIVPKNAPVKYTPPTRTASPGRGVAVPVRWQDLDAEVSADMKGTGTLSDPLLTDDERHKLRAKLASQMRGAARNYTPQKGRSGTPMSCQSAQFYGDRAVHQPQQEMSDAAYHSGADGSQLNDTLPGAATLLASHDAVSRLHSLTNRAIKHRRL